MAKLESAGIVLTACFALAAASVAADDLNAAVLQRALDDAPPHALVVLDPNETHLFSESVVIRKPVTLQGLRGRLPDALAKTPMLIVEAEGFTLRDFVLRGNADSVDQDDRAPLVVVNAGEFRIENGEFRDSSKDGVMINAEGKDLVGGVVRDVTGYNTQRDVVSIGGDAEGNKVRNVLVDNVRCYGSPLRGAVEVSDGTDNITVRKVYAERAVYAVDVQDHGRPAQVNGHVLIEDVYAVDCRHAVRTANRPHGHHDLTLRDITAVRCEAPLRVSNTDRVSIRNVRILSPKGPIGISLENCRQVSVRDVFAATDSPMEAAVRVHDCDSVLVDGVSLDGKGYALRYTLRPDRTRTGLLVSNIQASEAGEGGIYAQTPSQESAAWNLEVSSVLVPVEMEPAVTSY